MSSSDIDFRLHPVTSLLEELVRRPSITPDDHGCQDLLAERLAPLGFDCESMVFGDVTNLWARRGTSGPLLCFAGHTDVVPPGALDEWHSDPFVPRFSDGLMFGRGTADMKGSLAAMIVALEQFVADHPDHKGSLAMLITSDEEGPADDGTVKVIEALTARDEHIDMCVVGEPSSHEHFGDMVRIGRRGSLSGILTVRGVQGHVAYPQLADNPIHRFAPILHELQSTEWDSGNDWFPPTSFQVVNIAASAGAVNVTPGELSVRFNFRYSTEWTHEQLRERVQAIFDAHDIDYELTWRLSGEPFLTEPCLLVDSVVNAVQEITGLTPELSTGGGTSDGRFISPAGAAVVELGPVNASIHKVDEHVSLEDVVALKDAYRRIMELTLT